MASNFKISDGARNAGVDGIVDRIDEGAGAGTLEIFTGAPPANCAAVDSGTKLGTLTFSDPAFGAGGASVTGRADSNSITSDTDADASGDAGHFRAKDSDAECHFQGTAGLSGDTPDLVFDNKTIVAGGTVACTYIRVTLPEQ